MQKKGCLWAFGMGSLVAAGTGIGAVVLSGLLTPPEVRQAQIAQQLAEQQATAGVQNTTAVWAVLAPWVVGGLLFFIFAAFLCVGLMRAALALIDIRIEQRRRAVEPMVTVLDDTDYLGNTRSLVVGDFAPAKVARGSNPYTLPKNVPHTLTLHSAPVVSAQAGPVADIAAQFAQLTALQAAEMLPRNALMWCFGSDTAGPLTQPIADSVHTLNAGGSGQGKSAQAANLVYQVVKRNDSALYSLLIADIKGTLAKPFAPWCEMTATDPAGYVAVMKRAYIEVERRRANELFGEPMMLVVIEEALAVKDILDDEQLKEYQKYHVAVASYGREYGVFLLACAQVDYSDPKTRVSRALYMTRMMAAMQDTAARSLGFTATESIRRLWREKKKGQFLIEGPDGPRVIMAPFLDLKAGDLVGLLADVPKPRSKGVTRPGGMVNRPDAEQPETIPTETFPAIESPDPEREIRPETIPGETFPHAAPVEGPADVRWEQLIRLAAKHPDGKLTDAAFATIGIGNAAKRSEMRQAIRDAGWLDYAPGAGNGYQLSGKAWAWWLAKSQVRSH